MIERTLSTLARSVVCVFILGTPAMPGWTQTSCPPGSAIHLAKRTDGIVADFAPPAIGEVALKGIVKTSKGYIAMAEDCRFNKSLTMRVGRALRDGRVTSIDDEGVTFEFYAEAAAAAAPRKTKRLTLEAGK